jgi:hypothetical protein
LAVVVVLAAPVVQIVAATPAEAARCVSGAEIRQQISTFVLGLRDDVHSSAARSATRAAFIQSVNAARGAKADTPAEQAALGQAIAALAKQLHSATNLVERDALIAEIHALQDQKKSAPTTAEDVQTLRTDIHRLGGSIEHRTDTAAEDRQVAEFVHNLLAQFNC